MPVAKNAWEAEARARKCAALTRSIRSDLGEYGRNAESAASIAVFLRNCDEAFWTRLAIQHGIRKPSAATIEAVCLSFEADAEDAARTPSPELDEAVEAAFTDLEWR